MKTYGRFLLQNRVFYGILSGDLVQELSGTSPENFSPTDSVWPASSLQILPLSPPGKIVGTGLNYKDISPQSGCTIPAKPKIFLKSPQSMISQGDPIFCPSVCKTLTAEVELAVVIGKTAQKVSVSRASQYVWGYLTANDVTASDIQKEDVLWGRAKNFDTFLPLSSLIVSEIDPSNLVLHCFVNKREERCGNSSSMIQDVPHLISYISHIMTLLPGDLILTGTPTGYGVPVSPGDRIRVSIDGVGEIENPVCQSN